MTTPIDRLKEGNHTKGLVDRIADQAHTADDIAEGYLAALGIDVLNERVPLLTESTVKDVDGYAQLAWMARAAPPTIAKQAQIRMRSKVRTEDAIKPLIELIRAVPKRMKDGFEDLLKK